MKNETMGVTELTLAPEIKKNEGAVPSADLAGGAASMPAFIEKAKPQKAKRLAEIPALRGRDHKVFRMSDGTEQAEFSAHPIFASDDKQLSETAFAITEDEDGKHFTCKKENFCARFSKKEDDELFSIEEGVHKVTVCNARKKSSRHKHEGPALHKKENGKRLASDTVCFANAVANADYEYAIKGNGVKEDIVVKKPAAAYRYPFALHLLNVGARVESESKRIAFLSKETGEEVFYIPAPFMKDANGAMSTAVNYEVTETENDTLLLTVVADTEWMNAAERAFPVTIDPQIYTSGSTNMETFSWNDGNMFTATSHTIGFTGSSANRMYMSFTMPKLPRNPRIKRAELVFYQKEASLSDGERPLIGLYHVTSDMYIGMCTPFEGGNLIDYARMYDNDEETAKYTFDVSSLVDSLKWGENDSPRLVLKLIDEDSRITDNIVIYSSLYSAYSPRLIITYESSYGVNTSYRTHTHDLGRFGQGSVDLQRGNLMFESVDFAWSGNKMPVTIKHLFNSSLSGYMYANNPSIDLNTAYFASMQIGYGFKLNIMQSMMHLVEPPVDWNDEDSNDSNRKYDGYVYIGENGEETYFIESTRKGSLDTVAQEYTLYESVDDNSVIYDSIARNLTMGSETYHFDISGRLDKITDDAGNAMEITYTDNRITSVTDGAGRVFCFTYDANTKLLLYITAPDGTRVSYAYTNNLLSHITYPTGEKASIAYSWNKPQSVTLQDKNYKVIYKVAYTYTDTHLASVTEYGADGTMGAKSTYSYSIASARTLVTTTVPKDTAEGEVVDNVIKTTYTFDDDGNVVSEYVHSKDTGNVGGDGKESGINPHSGDGGVDIAGNSNNLLKNHNFYDLADWWEMPDNCDELKIENIAYTSSPKYGNRQLRIASPNSSNRARGVYQDTVTLPIGKYTFSAYVRVYSVFNAANQPGIFLRVVDTEGKTLGVSERIRLVDSEYVRLIVPFTLNTAQSVRVQILANGVGAAYVNAPQLESNPYASPYNMMENGSFEYSLTSTTEDDGEDKGGVWRCDSWDGIALSNYTAFHLGKSLRIRGDLNNDRYLYQDLSVKSYYSTRETFTLSGWAKGYALPDHERFDVDDSPTFALRAAVVYHDGETEEFIANFAPRTGDWQFASVQISKSKRKALKYIRVFCEYGYNVGDAYFDNIQFTRDSIETELEASNFGDTSTEVATQEEDAPEKDTAPVFEEAKDEYGNALTETTFADGDLGTIYRAFVFNVDNPECPGNDAGNNLVEETDARGYKTTYTVDGVTSRSEEVTDRLGNKTSYEYDDSGRTTKVTGKKADGTGLANVSYTYDAFDNMTEIARGDGMKYALAYNAFHNLESIGINSKTEKLIKYTYKNGNGRLKQMTYANGHTMKATYNSIGQMVAERWFETEAQAADPTATPVAHYKYVYDGDGNIARSIDILAGKEYTYEYEDGRIVRAAESTVSINDDNVTSKTLLNTVRYCYDSEGNVTKKVVTPESGSAQTIYYENSDESTVAKFSAGGRTVTSHSKTDSFGRKVFDELQLGTDFVSRQFVYHAGKVTSEHKTNAKVKSSATTQLVSQIILSNGTTISYGYDAEERITSVVESYTVDETPVTNTTLYTYDALDQLLTETVNGETVNSMEYDNYGNITKKNGKDYSYGNATWKDLLTGFDGKTIEYDAQGNPTSYLGHTLTWEKGRQLKSFDNNTYTYNANGIRTSKTVGGVKHTYTLEGTKILRESWSGKSLIPLYDNEDSVCGILYNNVPYYFLKNLQGDVIAIVDKDAETVARYSYDAWGVPTIAQDSVGIATINPFRYRSYYYDEEIGLYYLQSRYYDAAVGRFINEDKPICICAVAQAQFCSLYPYCDNNPIRYSDSIGLGPWSSSLSLFDYRKIHNTVADKVASSLGSQAKREYYVKGKIDGKTCRGFLDVYEPLSHTYYEVKSYMAAYTIATQNQMRKYDNSKPPTSWRGNVKRGTRKLSGSFWYGAWKIQYSSSKTINGLVEYIPTYKNGRTNTAKSTVTAVVIIGLIVLAIGLVVGVGGAGALAFLAI